MTQIFQDYFVGFLFVVVIWLIGLYLPWQAAAMWSLTQTILLLILLNPHYHMGWRWAVTAAYVGFQFFAVVTANIAKREAVARQEQDHVNVQLLSTRELLAESSRIAERMRITRDLHDVLGHHLAALAIQLEISANSSPEQTQDCVKKAQVSCTRLLSELRHVVNVFRSADSLDLGRALSVLADNVPGITLHLDLPQNFEVTDGARAHAILRCIQEATTNTIKHAAAANLWITISVVNEIVEITARDDGRGAGGAKPGAGLVGMRERLEQLGGGLNYELGKQSGFSFRAWLPTFRTAGSA
jgi:signal transduction histidine kinase